MSKVVKVWAFLPLKVKAAIIVVAAVAVYLAYRYFFKKNSADEFVAEQLESSVSTTPVNKSNVTLTDNELKVMSAQLYEAMKGAGTNTGTVDTVLSRIKTKDDLNALIRAYGVRDGEDLRMWFKGDLSGTRLAAVRQIFEDLGVVF